MVQDDASVQGKIARKSTVNKNPGNHHGCSFDYLNEKGKPMRPQGLECQENYKTQTTSTKKN
jgi:hypothetical protein